MHALEIKGELLPDVDDEGEERLLDWGPDGPLASHLMDPFVEHDSPNERPTIPVPAPRDSGVRLRVARVAYPAATVDVVLCDLSRDPRSESYSPPLTRATRVTYISELRRGKRRRFGW